MDSFVNGLLILIVASGAVVGWALWSLAQKPRRRDQARLRRQREWAESGSWPADWRDYYPTGWEYGEDYPRMFALGYQAESDQVDEHGGHSVIWIHREFRQAVEQGAASAPPSRLERR